MPKFSILGGSNRERTLLGEAFGELASKRQRAFQARCSLGEVQSLGGHSQINPVSCRMRSTEYTLSSTLVNCSLIYCPVRAAKGENEELGISD